MLSRFGRSARWCSSQPLSMRSSSVALARRGDRRRRRRVKQLEPGEQVSAIPLRGPPAPERVELSARIAKPGVGSTERLVELVDRVDEAAPALGLDESRSPAAGDRRPLRARSRYRSSIASAIAAASYDSITDGEGRCKSKALTQQSRR